nr:hypothetical protein CFP56_53628 [Quercus suber]
MPGVTVPPCQPTPDGFASSCVLSYTHSPARMRWGCVSCNGCPNLQCAADTSPRRDAGMSLVACGGLVRNEGVGGERVRRKDDNRGLFMSSSMRAGEELRSKEAKDEQTGFGLSRDVPARSTSDVHPSVHPDRRRRRSSLHLIPVVTDGPLTVGLSALDLGVSFVQQHVCRLT